MKLHHSSAPDSHAAFRLPKEVLARVDTICSQFDLTRLQIFRKSLTQFISTLADDLNVENSSPAQKVESPSSPQKLENHATWLPELYDRVQRKR